MSDKLRVIVADDERPARLFLVSLLQGYEDVAVVGEAGSGAEAVRIIEETRPDVAFLDLQMPEMDGLSVVSALRSDVVPLVAFVTAYDEYAVRAFEANAIDYLLKPVEPARLRATLTRAHDRLDRPDRADEADRIRELSQVPAAGASSANIGRQGFLLRIPVRRRDDIVFVHTSQVASISADGELLHITTHSGARHTITYRLKDLESRLDPVRFVRISRGTIVNSDAIASVSPMPGGTYQLTLANKQQFRISRLRSRTLREELLRL